MAGPFGAKTGGRTKGTPNSNDDALARHARRYAKMAIETLAQEMKTAKERAVRVSAANALLDRAYGKATQHHGGEKKGEPIRVHLSKDDENL